jgi:hypothetical protein
MFAEDANLLPVGLLRRLTAAAANDPSVFADGLGDLFAKMSRGGGLFGAERIEWFNGGLFDSGAVLPLTQAEIEVVDRVSRLDWSQVEPAIFGTLFERGLDPDKRTQLGAHYTDRASIMRLIEPVLLKPLRRDLEETKKQVQDLLASGKTVTARTPASKNPVSVFNAFLQRLRAVRVLDPACGSGNFLYLALQSLKDLEREAILWASLTMKIPMQFPEIGPQAVLGIELNPYAGELARVVIWIGEIQWMISNGFAYLRDPILKPLDTIEERDALLDLSDPENPREPDWPEATVIVGNPPFLGAKLLRGNLGDDYVESLFKVYRGRVAGMADLVAYWHEKARAMVQAGKVDRVGLLATQGIRGGGSRETLRRIKESGDIFLAWSDEPWVVEGAAVHVSFIVFDNGSEKEKQLNGKPVVSINANLSAGVDLAQAVRLQENAGIGFVADVKGGAFDIPEDRALAMLSSPNPDGRDNRDVVRPWANGLDVTRRPRHMWIIDFGIDMPVEEAMLYEAPFEYIKTHVQPQRESSRTTASDWWRHERPGHSMREGLAGLDRFIATPTLSKHQLIVFARDDYYFFGVLHSHPHELWSLRLGTRLETRPRYTPTTTFETFPLPESPAMEAVAEVGNAARTLCDLRAGWLNPPGVGAAELEKRTLTNLYNQRPTWLAQAHERLDRAVHTAYGWEWPLEDDEVLSRLLEMNLARAGELAAI